MKIAMWSGPRNLSTAMMYSFSARGDCAVWDEPFYAAYLAQTGLVHPMQTEILAAGEIRADVVARRCTEDGPNGAPHFYQKHMTHHMVPGVPRDWMKSCVNVFLIRHPARVIASYAAKRENPTLDDLGFSQQLELFEVARAQTGSDPAVLDTSDLRQDPAQMLEKLCAEIGLSYTDRMLTWPKGTHPDDGAWAPHWYGAIHNSSGFAGAEGPLPNIEKPLQPVLQAALPIYERLKAKALTLD